MTASDHYNFIFLYEYICVEQIILAYYFATSLCAHPYGDVAGLWKSRMHEYSSCRNKTTVCIVDET